MCQVILVGLLCRTECLQVVMTLVVLPQPSVLSLNLLVTEKPRRARLNNSVHRSISGLHRRTAERKKSLVKIMQIAAQQFQLFASNTTAEKGIHHRIGSTTFFCVFHVGESGAREKEK